MFFLEDSLLESSAQHRLHGRLLAASPTSFVAIQEYISVQEWILQDQL